ncbi:MAG: hypothetical protein ACYCXW_02740 [Solirubrobacteraceae bacterium]
MQRIAGAHTRVKRPRHYVSPALLAALRPCLRYSYGRSAYVLRVVGERRGPVLRPERRRNQRPFVGRDRRAPLTEQRSTQRAA